MKDIKIKLSEEKVKALKVVLEEYLDSAISYEGADNKVIYKILEEIKEAEKKPYTNFEYERENMDFDDFMYVIMYSPNYEPKMWCKKGLNDCRKCSEDNMKCMKDWLNEEHKEEVKK